MDFDEYQTIASTTATFEEKSEEFKLMYLALGITGESGEIAEKVKKLMRNDSGALTDEHRASLTSEMGDVLWYLSQLSRVIGVPFSDVAATNVTKIKDREARGVIKSTGDNR